MKTYILSLNDAQADLNTVGGKGSSLTRLINAGLPVPGGFHVTTKAYRDFVNENDLRSFILTSLLEADPSNPKSLESVSHKIRQRFASSFIPEKIESAILMAYADLNNAPVAVRSSATAEDLPDASFAGQQDTYLNICGPDSVLNAVKNCWASLWTPRAIAYRIKNAIDQNSVALAVVVQELVFADAAGILFTANPINGKRDEVVINAAWGLGEAVVSGQVTPDTVTINKLSSRVVTREIADKQVMTVRTQLGTEEKPVPKTIRKKAVLTRSQISKLTQFAIKIEQFYGMPMDVEWALADDQFAIVQARPITILPLEWKVPDPKAVYARGSLAEHTPSPVTPLFATLGLRLANEATSIMWKRVIGKNSKNLVGPDGFYIPLNGYVFGGIRMSGKEFFTVIRMTISQIGPIFRGSVARWQTARKQFATVVNNYEQVELKELNCVQLLEQVNTVFRAACVYFTDIQSTLPAASSSEVIFTFFYEKLIRRKTDPGAAVFLLGSDNISLRSEKSLFDLAEWIQTKQELAKYLIENTSEDLINIISQETGPHGLDAEVWIEWQHRLNQHLDKFGRTAYEFDFAKPTPMETPGPMIDAIRGYLSGKSSNPYERQVEILKKRDQAIRNILARVGWPVKGWFIRLLQWAQETNPMREDSIFDMGMGHPLTRRIFAELGSRFVALNIIEQEEDIYWLNEEEVLKAANGLDKKQPVEGMSDRIPKRKDQWQTFFKATPPVMLPEKSGWRKVLGESNVENRVDGKVVLNGVGTSSGKVTAPACVLMSPEDFGKLRPGDVLVAVTTTPAWTPLFGLASAVVTDIGGPLSHSSIVAREYGIPAVMAVRSATRTIQSGQMITVDGGAGVVTLE
jgi:pyruvate,water dikinase